LIESLLLVTMKLDVVVVVGCEYPELRSSHLISSIIVIVGASLLNNLGMACAEQFFALDPKMQQEQREHRLRRLAAQHKKMQLKLRVQLQKRQNKSEGAVAKEGDVKTSGGGNNNNNNAVAKEEVDDDDGGDHEESLSKFDEAVELLQEALDIRTVQRGLLHTGETIALQLALVDWMMNVDE